MMLISCSRTAVGCETRTSPGCTFDNDWGSSHLTSPEFALLWEFALFRSGHDGVKVLGPAR
jgi:hypothetical protein